MPSSPSAVIALPNYEQNLMTPPTLLDDLRSFLGDRIATTADTLAEHAVDVSHHPAVRPDAVAFPESTDEVSRIVKSCHVQRVPVIPFGTGTAVEGGVVATHGGVSVDLRRMNRILRVSPVDMDATVEAGVTRLQLNRDLADRHAVDDSFPPLLFPIDPGADASLGGMSATNASGSAAVRFGTMRNNVLGLTVVLPDGRIIHTGGRARKSSAGYNLTGLFVGSEGTLGIVTELTLRLHRIPEAIAAAVCPFPDSESAIGAAIAVLTAGIPVARLEYLDEVLMDAVNRYSNLDYAVTPTLFFEFHGTPSLVEELSRSTGAITARHNGGEFIWATQPEERQRLWQARYDAYYACLALRPDSTAYPTDVCVPISNLAECIRRAKQHVSGTSLACPIFGHVGDGNFHVCIVFERGNERELEEAREIARRIVDDALELEGTCTGEHGIGLGKREALLREHGPGVDVMRAIKSTLDTHEIMNPGKVLESRR
jgi:D-lactate dehydrogenase (cytochrome)